MTLPRALRLLLICFASRRVFPVAAVFLTISDPARSQTKSFPVRAAPEEMFFLVTVMMKMLCDRDEAAFMLVEAVARAESP